MEAKSLSLPSHGAIRRHICQALSLYWSEQRLDPSMLPVPVVRPTEINGPLRLLPIPLPDWACECAVEGKLFVPMESCPQGNDWKKVDWWLAAFLLLEGWHERTWELNHGPIHSYSFRLAGWDPQAWDRAWVNRIGLLLRAWSAKLQVKPEIELFGPLPKAHVLMSHDVDAIDKTLPIRLKQGAFNIFNSIRHLLKGEGGKATAKLHTALRFLFRDTDWWTFDTMLEIEKRAEIRAQFNFYADTRRKTLMRWLFDPGYDIGEARIKTLIRHIEEQDGIIGLHPTFDAWNSAIEIRQQKERLESVATRSIKRCRQHWLRFSWQHTWASQEDAKIEHDTTLMFNDRPGFRASAALSWQPWDHLKAQPRQFTAMPSIMMDSHFFDYGLLTHQARRSAMHYWLQEVLDVSGQAAVLWHPHTMSEDYGWADGFNDLVDTMEETLSCLHLH